MTVFTLQHMADVTHIQPTVDVTDVVPLDVADVTDDEATVDVTHSQLTVKLSTTKNKK